MSSLGRRRTASQLVLAFLPVALLLTLGGQASAASLPDHGSTVRCRYHTDSDTNWSFTAQFRRIVVTPPQMFALSGRQRVGWSFSVNRLIDVGGNQSWTTTYTSPIQRATATTSRAASFDNMRVGVTVPRGDWSRSSVEYTVTVHRFWYRANGTVQKANSFLISSSYDYYVNGAWWDDSWNYCPGVVRQTVDGPF